MIVKYYILIQKKINNSFVEYIPILVINYKYPIYRNDLVWATYVPLAHELYSSTTSYINVKSVLWP